ncbi:mitochondrial protein [Striga asiatica]|uniref:Mitochondrial protein n=1 Tax=Striga asiatica TaxID=4170 RepID=A0A5A7Q080_STRAF|nr:mitochondrial protein [Striga asiatica]
MENLTLEKTAKEMSKSMEASSETDRLEGDFSSPTPVKTKEPSRVKSKEELAKFPEKYEMLFELFERMTSSLRLLCLRKRIPTFQNIQTQVEILTGRKFLLTHLAQMKSILPEAVEIEKILVHDEKTKCMKPDMKIALLLDVVKDHNEESSYIALGKVFSSRLREFYISHPEGNDVPEAALPEPFNHKTINIKTDLLSEDLSTSSEAAILNLSHFPPSFKRRFHTEAAAVSLEATDISSPLKSGSEANEGINEDKSASEANGEIVEEVETLKSLPNSSSTVSAEESTPVKLLLGSDSVSVETPVLSTPTRSISPTRAVLTCEDEDKMAGSQTGKQSTSSAKKSLDFYGMDNEDAGFSNKQSTVCLSEFVCIIHQIFQAVNFCPITKEELVQKIIMDSFEFDDRHEVEMHMEGLEKLVPDWFCKKLACSGDLLYSMKKVSDLKSIRERVNVM